MAASLAWNAGRDPIPPQFLREKASVKHLGGLGGDQPRLQIPSFAAAENVPIDDGI